MWLSWKHVGSEGFGRLVEANIDLARHLARRIAASHDFEALPEVPELSVVCFRHLPRGRPAPAHGSAAAAELAAHQDRLQRALAAAFLVLRRRASAPVAPADPGEWWTCRKCGRNNVIGSPRCYSCGEWQG